MLKHSKSSLVLVLVFLSLFGYYWYFQREIKVKNTDTKMPEVVNLMNLKAEDINSVSWKNSTFSGELQKNDGKWSLVNPVGIQTDSEKALTNVNYVLSLSSDQVIATKNNSHADFGLQKPTSSIKIKRNDGKVETVNIGNKSIDNAYNYVLMEGADKIFLIASYTLDDILVDPSSLRVNLSSASPSSMDSITPQQ